MRPDRALASPKKKKPFTARRCSLKRHWKKSSRAGNGDRHVWIRTSPSMNGARAS